MTRPIETGADASAGTSMPSEDDPLLRELGAWARERADAERDQLDARWDRLAAGTLTPEEEAELRAYAEGSAGGAAALSAFQPLGPEAEARIVAQIRAQRAAEGPAKPAIAASRPVVASPPAARANDRANNVIPFRRRAAAWGGGLGLAAAAVLVAMLNLPGPLPTYMAELKGGDLTNRGAKDTEAKGIRTFSRGARFELVLRPAQAVEGNVVVSCLLVAAGGGAPRPFPACNDAKHSKDGSLRVTGTVGDQNEYPPGNWMLWAIVARTGELPKDPQVTDVAKPIAGKGWNGIPQPIRFGPVA